MKDCELCDDLCYITEPSVQWKICFGKGKQGNLVALSQNCRTFNGVVYTKPGMGVNVHINPPSYPMNQPGMAGPGYNQGFGPRPGMPANIPPSIPSSG